MRSLESYFLKRVRVVTVNNKEFVGMVETYTSAADNDDTEESIGVLTNEDANEGVELYLSDIKSIKEI